MFPSRQGFSGDSVDLTGSTTIDGATQSDDSGLGFGSVGEGESDFTCSGSTLTLDGEQLSRKQVVFVSPLLLNDRRG